MKAAVPMRCGVAPYRHRIDAMSSGTHAILGASQEFHIVQACCGLSVSHAHATRRIAIGATAVVHAGALAPGLPVEGVLHESFGFRSMNV